MDILKKAEKISDLYSELCTQNKNSKELENIRHMAKRGQKISIRVQDTQFIVDYSVIDNLYNYQMHKVFELSRQLDEYLNGASRTIKNRLSDFVFEIEEIENEMLEK